ncbi:apolipoprotein N-acyltransferase [Bifidobacterium adolescentis ATCC 15703]|uniref:Apolipoprotein N-acyltransferase n=1 Tax=Bifidobacterium adolescentis (strain ATCC 15703 / DSM 20083 / NCTC 11814 / E194a) TaxID=367928 RepID=A1A2T8_BIFAA|nr:apolipoprotein N-acyltransferase [Bifidobacterium adolescentis ATCC 15703]
MSSRYHSNTRRSPFSLENIGIHHQNRREKDISCLLGTSSCLLGTTRIRAEGQFPLENIGIHHQNRRENSISCLLSTNVSSRYHFVSSRYHFVSFEYLNTLGALLSQGFEGNPLYTYIPILENRFVSSGYQL